MSNMLSFISIEERLERLENKNDELMLTIKLLQCDIKALSTALELVTFILNEDK